MFRIDKLSLGFSCLARSLLVEARPHETVNVHIVTHSHMDAGWRSTFDQYYEQSVRQIFDSVFEQLEADNRKTYTVGDIAFFKRYYTSLEQTVQDRIKALVKRGQLELLHGGMVSTDEACPNYSDILRNFELGQDFLRTEFAVEPKIAWQLDTFGHSSAIADLFSEMGMETVVFARMNEQSLEQRKLDQEL